MEDPMPIGPRTAIPLHDVMIRVSRSSGPGGQHANVTASRVEASLDVLACEALTDAQRRLIISRTGGPRVVAIAQDTRSQARNRELALQRLQHRLQLALKTRTPRRETKPTRAAMQKRLDAKHRHSQRKRDRGQRHDTDSS
jgi:ribosome-associated protein